MKTITIDIASDGSIHMDADGFVGPACEEVMKGFLDALGAESVQRTLKPEHARRVTQVTREVKHRAG